MLSIKVMVTIGPWTLTEVEFRSQWTNCERCGQDIKEVWHCHVDPQTAAGAEILRNKTEWQVGNDCGPQLIEDSKDVWAYQTSDYERLWKLGTSDANSRARLAKRIIKANAAAAQQGTSLPAKLGLDQLGSIMDGTAPTRHRKHLGMVLTHYERQLGLKKKPRY